MIGVRRFRRRPREGDRRHSNSPSRPTARASPVRTIKHKIDSTYQWYNSDGHWGYEPVSHSSASPKARSTLPPMRRRKSRQCRLGQAPSTSNRPMATRPASASISAGPATAPPAHNVVVTLDKQTYRAGDEMSPRALPARHYRGRRRQDGGLVHRCRPCRRRQCRAVPSARIGRQRYAVAITHRSTRKPSG